MGNVVDVWSALGEEVGDRLTEIYGPAVAALEDASLLGPGQVDEALTAMLKALRMYGFALRRGADGPGWPNWDAQRDAWPAVVAARAQFVNASREAIRSAPTPVPARRRFWRKSS